MRIKVVFFIFGLGFLTFSCSSGLLKYDKSKVEFKSEEFDKQVQIVELDEEKPAAQISEPIVVSKLEEKSLPEKNLSPAPLAVKKKIAVRPTKVASGKKAALVEAPPVIRREPDIEDSEGFNNLRRPPVDPFRVSEKVVHEVSYLAATAGTLTLMVGPYAVVNGRKAYNFNINIKTNSFFSKVYAVDDKVQTYVDFETLLPGPFKLDIRDSGQVKEAKSYFNFDNLTANYWEHRYTEKNGHEEKKLNWKILPYSQNPFSAIFYMRVFKWTVGQEYMFRVADDEKNVVFKAKALEKTKLRTEAGEFKAIKLKAEVVSRGNLAKASDFYMWLSDDDRKYVLRIEVKLPIGSLVSEVVDIEEGRAN